MLNVFTWLRQSVKAAVLGGVADAVAELDAGEEAGQAMALLRQRLALPAPENGHEIEAPARGRRKKEE